MSNEQVEISHADDKETWDTPRLVKGDVALDTMNNPQGGPPDGSKTS